MAGHALKPGEFVRSCELASCRQHFKAKAPHAKYCSPRCRQMADYNRNRRKHGVGLAERRPCEAPGCGTMFQPDEQHKRARYCSDACRHRAVYPKRRERLGYRPRESSSG